MKKQAEIDNEKNIKNRQKNSELKGVLFFAAGLFLLAAYAEFPTGFVGRFLHDVLTYGFGLGAFLFPFLFIAMGFGYFRLNKNLIWFGGFWAAMLFYVCLLGGLHHIFIPLGYETELSFLPQGGGLVGGLLSKALYLVAGAAGSVILLVAGMLASLVLTGKLSLAALTAKAGDKVQDIRATKRERRNAGNESTEEYVTEKMATDPFFINHSNQDDRKSSPLDVYNKDEFADYNEDVRKPSTFKKILNFGQKALENNIDTRNPDSSWREEETSGKYVSVERMANHENSAAEKSSLSQIYPEKQEKKVLRPAADKSRFILTSNGMARITGNSVDGAATEHGNTESYEKTQDADATSGKAVKKSDAVVKDKTLSENDENILKQEDYIFPPLDLLNPVGRSNRNKFDADVREQCRTLEKTLADFRVNARVVGVTRGPSVTRYELEPAPGVKVSSVVNLADDIALRLAAPGVRVEAPIPGKAAIGIEAPNIKNDTVSFREVVDCKAVRDNSSKLCIGLGKDISGNVITIDLSKMPHLLVAGSTGSGKSVCVNTLLAGIMYKARPDEVKLILVDPKVVELTNYNGIPHLLVPVVTDAKKAASALHWAVAEMERRYKSFADTRVRDIKAYNAQAAEKMPFILIVIDEMSDLMMVAKTDVEDAILRLAQKARACGIHLVLATQRPSVDVITGIVKANIPSRIAFAVSSQTDSRTILDMGGAEKLLGKGDMLFYPIGANKPLRVQGAFVSDEELNRVTDFIKQQAIPVEYSEEVTNVALPSDSHKEDKGAVNGDISEGEEQQDELLNDAIRLVLDLGQASSSMLQRRFRIGYNRAARLVDAMEELGIIGPAIGSKPRELLLSRDEVEYRFLRDTSPQDDQ